MKPTHALAIAAVLAVAAVLGLAAVTKTSNLGASAKQAPVTTLAARARRLDAFEASLKKALKSKPPALPKVPVGQSPASAGPVPRVVYRRPAPIVIHKHSQHGDDGYESDGGGRGAGGGDD